MARPPSTEVNETFLREVDEDLRHDRIRSFFVDNRLLLIAGVLLFLAVSGGLIWYKGYQQRQTGEQVEELAKVYSEIGKGQVDKAPAMLQPLEDSSSDGVRATAIFTAAAVAIQQGDQKAAAAKYKSIAEGDYPKPYKDLALIRQTALEFDQIKPEEVIARMKPLAVPGDPWFGSAGEMTALALIKQGKKDEAAKLFASLVRDETVPEEIRGRSVQIASSLGIDASDAMKPNAPVGTP